MILATFPHMALNSHNVPGTRYKMWNTWSVPKTTAVEHMVDWIATVADNAPDSYLQTLIFNSHGEPGKIKLGEGITRNHVEMFRKLKGKVGRIWIVACNVARIKEAGSMTDGNWFCYRLAQETGAYVTAASATQMGQWDFRFIDELPYGYIDDWEGTVYKWNPKGELC